nr:protein set domain group 41 [Quercus suber]
MVSSTNVTLCYFPLQEISSANLDASSLSSDQNVYRDYAIRTLTDYIDDAITQYLSFGDPELCCEKLEILLTQGLLYEQLEGREVKSQPTIKLHPLHYLCLNAYTTLASAYKVRASDLLGLYSELDEHLLEALDLSRTSAAYSLLLAGKLKMRILRIYLVSSLIVSLSLHKSWLGTSKYSSLRDVQPHLCSTAEGPGYSLQGRMHIFQLGVHCLLYGGYLASICYGRHSHLTSQVQNILDCEECLINDSHETD